MSRYVVEISRAYIVEATNDDEAVKTVLSADSEKLKKYHEAAENWEEVTAIYNDDDIKQTLHDLDI